MWQELVCGEAAVEGQVKGVHGALPAQGPAFAAGAGRVEAHDGHVDTFEGGLFRGEVPAGAALRMRALTLSMLLVVHTMRRIYA